ncbi:MAG TPA: hypothetical protein VK996_15345, partial [Ramlibacter sp.]|nr:hypothetical protein [Ramlibacter sp.]
SRLSDDAPWNTCVSPCYRKSATVDGDHHLIALFCTVAGKLSGASTRSGNFSNEINDLGRALHPEARQKPS